MASMNYDPTKYIIKIIAAQGRPGVDVAIVRLEVPDVKLFYIAGQTVDSPGLLQHLASMTDDLLIDFFVKGKEARKLEKERQKANERVLQP